MYLAYHYQVKLRSLTVSENVTSVKVETKPESRKRSYPKYHVEYYSVKYVKGSAFPDRHERLASDNNGDDKPETR